MAHLTKEYTGFFKDLAANNNREWFNANKGRYDQYVKLPFYELVAELIARAQKVDPAINLEVKNAVFRINRDIRFSNDKSPYKLHMSAVVAPGGRKDLQSPGIYVQVEAQRLMIAGGSYQPDKGNLERIRRHIIAHPGEALKLEKEKKFLALFPGGIGGEKNKILPAEFRDHAEKLPILFNKQFFYYTEYKGAKYVQDKDIAAFIMQHYKAGSNWMEFLREAIAP